MGITGISATPPAVSTGEPKPSTAPKPQLQASNERHIPIDKESPKSTAAPKPGVDKTA
jgi:hypothetical protein